MALATARGKVHVVQGNATTAEVTAGKMIVPGRAGKSIVVTGGSMRALGGSAATATSVDIKDTGNVVAVACGVAGLTQNTHLDFTAAANVTLTTYDTPLTADKGLKIKDTGSGLATATSIDYVVKFYYI